MSNNSKNYVRLLHIIDAVSEIEKYNEDTNFQIFNESSLIQNASIRQLEIIGEATKHLTEELKNKYQIVEWQQIVGLRNFLIHEYFGVDVAVVWNIIKFDLPIFKNHIKIILLEIKTL